jgi:hypothetical protein
MPLEVDARVRENNCTRVILTNTKAGTMAVEHNHARIPLRCKEDDLTLKHLDAEKCIGY